MAYRNMTKSLRIKLDDFISSNLKWDTRDEKKSIEDFKEAVKKEKENK